MFFLGVKLLVYISFCYSVEKMLRGGRCWRTWRGSSWLWMKLWMEGKLESSDINALILSPLL